MPSTMPRSCTATAPTLEAEVGRARAIDARHHLRLAATSVLLMSTAPGICSDPRDDLVADPLQLGEVVAADEDVDRRLVGRPA